MSIRSFFQSVLAVSLVAGLSLLLPSTASGTSITVTETVPGGAGSEPPGGATVTASCAGCDVFQTFLDGETIGFHAEWSSTDSNIDAVMQISGMYRLNFDFCEAQGNCSGFFAPETSNRLGDIPNAPGIILGPGVNGVLPFRNSNDVPSRFLTDFMITLIDQETALDPTGERGLGGIANLSDALRLTFSRGGPGPTAAARISLDATFVSDSLPEPGSLILVGTGLIGAGVKYRKRRKSAA